MNIFSVQNNLRKHNCLKDQPSLRMDLLNFKLESTEENIRILEGYMNAGEFNPIDLKAFIDNIRIRPPPVDVWEERKNFHEFYSLSKPKGNTRSKAKRVLSSLSCHPALIPFAPMRKRIKAIVPADVSEENLEKLDRLNESDWFDLVDVHVVVATIEACANMQTED